MSDHIITPTINKNNKKYYDTFNSYVIRSKRRNNFQKFLLKIEVVTGIDKGVHLQKDLYSEKIRLEKTEKIEKEILSLPIYPELTRKTVINM